MSELTIDTIKQRFEEQLKIIGMDIKDEEILSVLFERAIDIAISSERERIKGIIIKFYGNEMFAFEKEKLLEMIDKEVKTE